MRPEKGRKEDTTLRLPLEAPRGRSLLRRERVRTGGVFQTLTLWRCIQQHFANGAILLQTLSSFGTLGDVMSLSCPDYYKELHYACGEVLTASFAADTAGLHASSHSFVSDLEQWYTLLKDRPEGPILKAALAEYQFALLAVVQGQYRQAFMALRLSFELLMGTAYLSANEFQLRQWLRGERDLVWSALIDAECGVLSKQFVKAFYEELAAEAPQYRAMGQEVYRECSEYVHGNALTHTSLDGKVSFQQKVFDAWHDKAKTIRLVSSFALCARYVYLADSGNRSKLETVLIDNLGHMPAVRRILGAPVEQSNV